jgi:hypothetical protein
MKINPVHALLEVLRQQARAQVQAAPKARPGAVQEALRQQIQARMLEGDVLRPGTTIEQILAETKDTRFRLEMLEKLISDKFDARSPTTGSTDAVGRAGNLEKPNPTSLASSSATDALNQTAQQSHGRAWHNQPNLWNNADVEFLKYHATDAGVAGEVGPNGVAQKFTPTVEDIESALFKEGTDPGEFAKLFMARGEVPFDHAQQGSGPRLVPLVIGMMMLFVVGYLIF